MAISIVLSGCGKLFLDPVVIENEDLYYLKQASDSQWAVLMHFLTDGKTQITRAQWDSISQGMVCMNLKSFDDFNTEIAKACSELPCDYKQAINSFFLRLSAETGRQFQEIK